jgi:hypothetical protein
MNDPVITKLDLIKALAHRFSDDGLEDGLAVELGAIIGYLAEEVENAFRARRDENPPSNMATSEVWFREKVGSTAIWAKMAVGAVDRENYSVDKLLDNLRTSHYLATTSWESW